MTQFRDRPWEERFAAGGMGDLAEGKFVEWAEKKGVGYVRFGLDRPPIQMHALPHRLRHTPDYLMSKRFVEVQGFGNDQTFKLKLVKANCLHYWNDLHPVVLFIYDSKNDRSTFLPLLTFDDLLGDAGAELRSFPEGKSYYAMSGDAILAAGVDAP